MSWKWLLNILSGIVASILKLVSPEIRELITKLVKDLYKKAEATDNPWDDFLVELLAGILGVDLEN